MKHCLVVDDSRVIRMVARRILEELQFEISEAEDGRLALEACRRTMPDAILLDCNMPNMTGVEFLRALRRETGGERPVVFYCASENDPKHINEAITAGANECVIKPFDRDIIEAKFQLAGLV
jgi:two-component system chemotaxis response regulator CheY